MKPRIKTDTILLIVIVIFASILLAVKDLYSRNEAINSFFEFLGIMVMVQGIFLRMAARGHKKSSSGRSQILVTSGPYAFTRNPMYLGSFLIGCGYALILWPIWAIFIFALVFYWRFSRQMRLEEQWLSEKFGSVYKEYCKITPRIFPVPSKWLKARARDVFNLKEAFSTKETQGLLVWPLLAFVLEVLQEIYLYGRADVLLTLAIIVGGMLFFAMVFMVRYWIR